MTRFDTGKFKNFNEQAQVLRGNNRYDASEAHGLREMLVGLVWGDTPITERRSPFPLPLIPVPPLEQGTTPPMLPEAVPEPDTPTIDAIVGLLEHDYGLNSPYPYLGY